MLMNVHAIKIDHNTPLFSCIELSEEAVMWLTYPVMFTNKQKKTYPVVFCTECGGKSDFWLHQNLS